MTIQLLIGGPSRGGRQGGIVIVVEIELVANVIRA
jgi:hypothetical protein